MLCHQNKHLFLYYIETLEHKGQYRFNQFHLSYKKRVKEMERETGTDIDKKWIWYGKHNPKDS